MSTIVLCLAFGVPLAAVVWAIQARRMRAMREQLRSRIAIIEESLESAGAGTFIVDIDNRRIESSSPAARLIGLPADHTLISAKQWRETIHPDEREHVVKTVNELIAKGDPYTLDYRVLLPTGEARWLRSHGLPVKDAQQQVKKIYGTVIDITPLKSLEDEIRSRDQRLRDASMAGLFYTWEWDLDSDTFTVDRPAAKTRDASGRVIAGTTSYSETLQDVVARHHPDDRQVLLDMVTKVRQQDVPYDVEARLSHPDGTYHWNVSRGRVVRDETGRRRWVRGTIQDIHLRKQAELQVKEAEARMDRITRGTNDGLWEIDLAKQSLWVSPRMVELLGYSTEELTAKQNFLFDVTHPDDLPTVKDRFRQHLRDNESFDIEIRQRRKSGEWRWFRIRGACERDANGRAITISGSQQDITERRQYQQALIEATQQAAAANKAKSEFLANMSHEIRTPMNGVIGMTELLLETPLNPMQHDYAETVRDSAAALLTVINDILDFSKVEAGKLELENLDMDLRDTIEDVARLLAIQAHPKGLEVTALIDPTLPDLVRGDAGRIRQVLLNLGGNAVKFTQQGEVALDCKVIERAEQHTVVRCEIRDTGIGIPPDRVNALFQPFTQVDASTTRKFGGTGLGLSIVRRLVELMGGEVGVFSEEGFGSVFWFTLKLAAAKGASEARPALPAALKGQRILVVDDNATNRKVMMGQLILCHTEPVSASSANEALALMRQAAIAGKPFEVALLDHQMPGCDGAKLGKMIVADPTIKNTRLILLTSSGQRGDGQLFAELGFAGYLLKPVTQRDLTDCLAMVLSARAEAWHLKSQPIVTRHALRSRRALTRHRILLAEDNAVNQKVACRTLEKLGYRVDVAPDGRAAVSAWETGRYDLILMDCQMPAMDGYEATRTIRAREQALGLKRIPIVALTAHAMKGADELCTSAGMDDYLSKPIDRAQLVARLEQWLPTDDAEAEPQAAPVESAPVLDANASNESPIDWERLLKATDHDEELARELATLFIDSGLSTMQDIVTALESGDYGTLGLKAHEIKGSSANLQALATTAAAERLEAAARNGDKDQVPELTRQLKQEVERAVEFLRERVV